MLCHRIAVALALLVGSLAGCTTRVVSNTPRTALEQLLLSGAVDAALVKFTPTAVRNKTVFVDLANLKSYDAEYVKVAVRARFARLGATLVATAEAADYVAEVASGGLGTEFKEATFGLPAVPMPGSPTAFPELALYKSVEQTGIMKLLIFVHQKGQFVASGQYYAKCDRDEGFILFFRMTLRDDVREGWERSDAARGLIGK